MNLNKNENYYMNLAIKEAKKAYNIKEVPVGAIIVLNNQIIGRGYNKREKSNDITSHAEINAIKKAAKKIGSWKLNEAVIYVTIEPCPMCASAIIQSRIKKVVYGAKEPKNGAHESTVRLFDYPFNHQVEIVSGILDTKITKMMKEFFVELRNKS